MTEPDETMLERVAQAICFASIKRRYPHTLDTNALNKTKREWRKYEHDARFVLEVINQMVVDEQLADATADLPTLPDWLVTK